MCFQSPSPPCLNRVLLQRALSLEEIKQTHKIAHEVMVKERAAAEEKYVPSSSRHAE
jgi:hypothetical protein